MATQWGTEGKWSHGKTIPVKNVQALAANTAELTAEAIERYIRPERICDVVVDGNSDSIPVIDLGRLLDSQTSEQEASRLKFACQDWGFFQVKNHGIPDPVLENMRNDLLSFFRLPLDEKNKFGQLPGDLQGYGQAFVESEHQRLDWCDRLYLVSQPPHDRDMRPWPTSPVTFSFAIILGEVEEKELKRQPQMSPKQEIDDLGRRANAEKASIESYSSELMRVTHSLMGIIARNLGIDLDKIKETYVSQALRMAYYPSCPVAHDKVLGFSPHSDISMLTLVWELNIVEGLQIKRQDAWVPIKPQPKALVVNVGDFLEILTNGKYQSIEHRVTVNAHKERVSISAFHLPKFDTSVGPLSDIVREEEKKYKTLRVDEVAKVVFSSKLDGKKTKDYAMFSI